ncbi:MAG: GH3 auxin-responsive promoter family protein [Bacteroidia bacterium]
MKLVNWFASWNLKRRMAQIERYMTHPQEIQTEHLLQMVRAAAQTEWGKMHRYDQIETVADFQRQVPLSYYEDLYPYIERMRQGEADVLWYDSVQWFAKSSGTTNDKSKYIPITEASLHECHYKAGKDLLAVYFHHHPESQLFSGKILSVGGSHEMSSETAQIRCGDLSAILLENLPIFYELTRTPSKKVALMSDWESKLEAMCNEVMEENVTAIVGVPTWTMLLIQRMMAKKGITDHDLTKIWPNLEAFFHGGVNFAPYRQAFQSWVKHPMAFINIYNASEGFFAIQFEPESDDMLLMLDYGIFYEFIPMETFDLPSPPVLTLNEVEIGKNYAIIITTNGGLWRYIIGDTVTFTSLKPYKLKITGRTKHFINAFGEELMVENAEQAIRAACEATNATITDYTAAPYFANNAQGGGHEWLIEFERKPSDMQHFTYILDDTLKKLNSDYEAKRQHSIALSLPIVHSLPKGVFYEWMRQRGKLGGQNKVPRLANSRVYVDAILSMVLRNA